jgi:hypothetical protein
MREMRGKPRERGCVPYRSCLGGLERRHIRVEREYLVISVSLRGSYCMGGRYRVE